MDKSREVNAADVCRELEGLCLSWDLFQQGVFPQGCDNAIQHARCLFVLLGHPLYSNVIVAASGRSLTTTYLRELVFSLPWSIAIQGYSEIGAEKPNTAVLRRWRELIHKSECGELPLPQMIGVYLGVRFEGCIITRDGYSPAQPVEITSQQQLQILKFIYDAGEKGRLKNEMDDKGFTSLKQEKTKINEKLIPLDLRFKQQEHKLIHKDFNR